MPSRRVFKKPCVVCGELSEKPRCSAHRLPDRRPSTFKRGSRYAQQKRRRQALARDFFTCQNCSLVDPSGKWLHADHIVPVFAGGSNELENLQTLCKTCHEDKSIAESRVFREQHE